MTPSPCGAHLRTLGVRVPIRERLLIIQEEALIALDIQRVLKGAFGHEALIVRNFEQAEPLADRFAEFDLAVVTSPRRPGDHALAHRLKQAGAAIVVCSAARIDLSKTPLAGSPTVDKPFTDDDLLAACRAALVARDR
jgi:hypothetical protein